MKIRSWNVNGIRAAQRNGFLSWFEKEDADIVCLQETKARAEQLDVPLRSPKGYVSFWCSAEKAGYSGVALYSKKEPENIRYGLGDHSLDGEGRVLIAQYKVFDLINTYFPNSRRDHARLPFKLNFCRAMLKLCETYRKQGRNFLLCGDFNIAHKEIDLRNPKTNQNNAGFLPEERAWMNEFTEKGFVDTFREFEQGPDHYTWWSYRYGARKKNIGWRIDYFCVNPEFRDRVRSTTHQTQILGSDHCPLACDLRD